MAPSAIASNDNNNVIYNLGKYYKRIGTEENFPDMTSIEYLDPLSSSMSFRAAEVSLSKTLHTSSLTNFSLRGRKQLKK